MLTCSILNAHLVPRYLFELEQIPGAPKPIDKIPSTPYILSPSYLRLSRKEEAFRPAFFASWKIPRVS